MKFTRIEPFHAHLGAAEIEQALVEYVERNMPHTVVDTVELGGTANGKTACIKGQIFTDVEVQPEVDQYEAANMNAPAVLVPADADNHEGVAAFLSSRMTRQGD